jgi:alpha-glucosidase
MVGTSFSPADLLRIVRSLSASVVLASLICPLSRWLCDVRWGAGRRRTRRTAADRPLGDIEDYDVDGRSISLAAANGILHLDVLAGDVIRFRLLPSAPAPASPGTPARFPAVPPPHSYALDPGATWPPAPFEVEERDGAVVMRSAALVVRVDRSPCRLSFYDASGRLLSGDAGGLGFRGESGAYCGRALDEGEAIYGLGEKAFGLNLRGRALEMWNTDPQPYPPGKDPIYQNIPFLIGLRDGVAYGLFMDNPGRARFDLGHTRPGLLRYEVDTGGLCGYFLAGPGMRGVLARYTQLTGRMSLPPRWLLGYHQSRWSYYPESEVRDLAAQFRRRRIPCDAIHLDIHHMDGYRVFTWDRERFPDPARLIADLRKQGLRTVLIVDPGVKVDPDYAVYADGLARGMFCRLPDRRPFVGPVWPGDCCFPDFTDPEVRAWWGEWYRPLLEAGVAGFWNDMNEPVIFPGGTFPLSVVHSDEGRGASHAEVHNVYGMQMARASAEGLSRLRPGERIPLITRSAYAGVQRFALVWTGDNWSTWAHLRLGVSMCLNLGLSGVPLVGPDVGGFAGACDGELLARWTQVGALTPFFRNHAALDTPRHEPWAFGEPFESICRRWIELRYELLPYLYTAAWQAAQAGVPMMRPLAFEFPADRRTYSLADEFMAGDALLAAPVGHRGQVRRPVYLPGGTWYDFWTGQACRGDVQAEAPLERMPLYVRAGSVLPMGPAMQHSGEWPPEFLELHIYAGDGESVLYEDDGHSLAYQSGEFRLTRFTCRTEGGRTRAERRVEGPFDPGYRHFAVTVHGLGAEPLTVRLDGRTAEASYDAARGSLRLRAGDWRQLEIE